MGKKRKTDTDVSIRLAEMNAKSARHHEKHVTIRLKTVAVCTTVFMISAIGMICWAVVQIAEQPPWLTFCLALFGPGGLAVTGMWIAAVLIDRRIRRLKASVEDHEEEREEQGE